MFIPLMLDGLFGTGH